MKLLARVIVITSFLYLTGCACCGYQSYNSVCGLGSCTDQAYIVTDYPCAGMYGCDGYGY